MSILKQEKSNVNFSLKAGFIAALLAVYSLGFLIIQTAYFGLASDSGFLQNTILPKIGKQFDNKGFLYYLAKVTPDIKFEDPKKGFIIAFSITLGLIFMAYIFFSNASNSKNKIDKTRKQAKEQDFIDELRK